MLRYRDVGSLLFGRDIWNALRKTLWYGQSDNHLSLDVAISGQYGLYLLRI